MSTELTGAKAGGLGSSDLAGSGRGAAPPGAGAGSRARRTPVASDTAWFAGLDLDLMG